MDPREELEHLRKEHARLSPFVHEYARKVEEIEKVVRHFSKLFTAVWVQRDKIERRMMVLEKKVKHLKPHQGKPHQSTTKDSTKALLAKLKPEELKALVALLEKGA